MHREFTQLAWSPQIEEDLRRIVRLAVFEDLDRGQDWTTVSLVPEEATGTANIVARKAGVIAGSGRRWRSSSTRWRSRPSFSQLVQDGDAVAAGAVIATISRRGPRPADERADRSSTCWAAYRASPR